MYYYTSAFHVSSLSEVSFHLQLYSIHINLFSGGFIITMSHLPGWVLNFKIPHAQPLY